MPDTDTFILPVLPLGSGVVLPRCALMRRGSTECTSCVASVAEENVFMRAIQAHLLPVLACEGEREDVLLLSCSYEFNTLVPGSSCLFCFDQPLLSHESGTSVFPW